MLDLFCLLGFGDFLVGDLFLELSCGDPVVPWRKDLMDDCPGCVFLGGMVACVSNLGIASAVLVLRSL